MIYKIKRLMENLIFNNVLTLANFNKKITVVPFHIIGRFIKISNSRNMEFSVFSQNISIIVNHNSSIMQSPFHFISFKYTVYNHHIVSFSQFLHKLRSHSIFSALSEFCPRQDLSRAIKERSIETFLHANDISSLVASCFNHKPNSVQNCISLHMNWSICGFNNLVLSTSYSSDSRRASLFI